MKYILVNFKLMNWKTKLNNIDFNKVKTSGIYKVWISPLINVSFSTIGNTAGLWMSYFIINYIFYGFWEDLKWPGFESFEKDGVFLILSFAFLTSVIYYSSRRSKINGFFVVSLVLLIVVSFFYARTIAVEQTGYKGESNIFENLSIYVFLFSILLYYIVLVYENIKLNKNMSEDRDEELKELKKQRRNG